ncbi:hypothetical protein Hamer_G001067, partial [Homarus americanus]
GHRRSKRNVDRRQEYSRLPQDRRSGRSRDRGHSGISQTPQTRPLPRPHTLPRVRARPRTKSLTGPHTRVVARPTSKVEDPPSGAPPVMELPTVVTQSLTNTSGDEEASRKPVILQEEPYLSPTFVRADENGQGFRHYRDFYQESGEESGSEDEAATLGRYHTRPSVRSFTIPETIVKDGQIYYRYDAGVDASGSIKGQSKRSNARNGEYPDNNEDQRAALHPPADDFPLSNEQSDAADPLLQLGVPHAGQTPVTDGDDFYPGPSQVQTQAQMGSGVRGAVAGAVMRSGPATQVVGSSGAGGFFSAQAQSMGHSGGMSQTQVMGNMHGVQGLAMTHSNGHQSQAHLQMGAHSSSRAEVSTNEGAPLLVSNVGSTQQGGSAGAQAHGPAAANTHAQMDFTPEQHQPDGSGLRGQGLASAVMTPFGGSALASLAGDVSGGSFLGVAHSSSGSHHLANTQPSPPPHPDHHPPPPQVSAEGYTQGGGRVQDEFSSRDFFQPGLGSEGFTEDQYLHEDFTPGEVTHEFPFLSEQVGPDSGQEELVTDDLNRAGLVLGGGREDAPLVDQPVAPSAPSHSSMTHDMLSNIMETVHQPHMVPEVAAYPSQTVSSPDSKYVIDNGGMTGGAGTPPRKSEVGKAPLHTRPHIEEGVGVSEESTHGGQVGLATYSQGRLGPAPSPGDLMGSLPHYDYGTYDHPGSEYYDSDYNPLTGQQAPYFDLGPQIFRLDPLELDNDHLQPTTTATSSTESPEEHYDEQEGLVVPDPPIVVHQVQTTTPHLPSEGPQPHITPQHLPIEDPHFPPPQPHITPQHLPTEDPHFPPQPHITPQHLPIEDPHFPPPQPHITPQHLPTEDPHFPPPQPHIPSQHLHREGPHVTPPELHTPVPDSLPRVETHMPATHRQEVEGGYESRGSASQPESRPWMIEAAAGSVHQTDVVEDMTSVPLVPASPGGSVTLPGTTGGPIVNVMTMPASHTIRNSSLLAQRPGTPIHPGEKIPGAPGYRVPPGFRGHVILGHDLPVEADSRRVVEGFNTHVRLTPQGSLSNTVYASVGGLEASQSLREDEAPGVHVTLSGGGQSQSPGTPSVATHSSLTSSIPLGGSTASMQTSPGRQHRPSSQWKTSNMGSSNPALTHSPMRARPRPEPHPDMMTWSSGRGGLLPGKSWDGAGRGNVGTPRKSWSQTWSSSSSNKSWGSGDQRHPSMCVYFTINCQVVYSPYQQSEVCKPSYTTQECCC